MRIGVDASCWLNRRGFGRYTRELLRAILALDRHHEYCLFLDAETARRSEDLPPLARAARVVVTTSAAAAQAASADGRRSLSDLWAMRRAVAARDLDVMYFPAVYTYFPVRTRARVLVTKHDMTDRRYPELIFPTRRSRFFWELKVRHAIHRADLVATVSEASKRDIVRAFGLPDDRVRVVSDAVDPRFRPVGGVAASRSVIARYGIDPNRPFVLYVGGISPHKNLETLLHAFADLAGRPAGSGINLVLVGDFTGDVFYSSYPAVQRTMAQLELGRRVVFAGFVPDEDLVHCYNLAAVLVLPSLSEGFGLPALEAMACGIPVVASNAGALPEVVGDAGLLVNPSDVAGLADAMARLVGDETLRRQLGARGRERAQGFTWEKSARAALALFDELRPA